MTEPKNQSTHWAQIAEAGAISGLRFMFACFRWGGRPLFQAMAVPATLYFFLTQPHARRASLTWLARLQVAQGLRRYGLGLRHFWSFGMAMVDKLAVWKGKLGVKDVVVEGGEVIHGLLTQGQGAVLVISHHGNFEICHCLSAHHPQMRLTVLVHTKNSEKFTQFMAEQVGQTHTELLQVTEVTPATAMLLSERVERGEFVVIAGDRVPVGNSQHCIWADFLGEPAPFPAGPFTLAAILRVPLVTVFCARDPAIGGRYRIRFQWLSQAVHTSRRQRMAHLQQLVTEYARQLEAQCRYAPLQWFNFFDFWHHPGARQPGAPQHAVTQQNHALKNHAINAAAEDADSESTLPASARHP